MTNRLAAVCLTAISLVVAPTTWAQSDEPITISIEESQPLSDALQSFADQTDLQVIFFADITEGKTTSGVEGDYSVDTALDTLLADTGLSYTFIDDTAVSVQAVATSEGGDSDSKNLNSQPGLMAQNQTTPTTQTTTSRSSEGGTSIVTGKVTDARTGANLKGAKVTIEETGQWTSTNDLGEFRFVSVPTGTATLTVSYLGYAGQSAVVGVRGDGTSQSFALRGGSEIEEVVVFGQRSARALALNQERTADNFSTVLSSDMLGRFPGTTIAETLRRAPGVAFTPSFETGDGVNVIVRGLGPEFNTVTLNGLRLPVGNAADRSPSLNNLLTDSISEIRISKTLLPSQDSSGTGALIDIETKGPLDRTRRFANIGVESAKDGGDFLRQTLLTGTVSGTFGSEDDWGLGVSVQYRDRSNETVRYNAFNNQFGEYLPLQEDGTPVSSISQIDPAKFFPFEAGVDTVYPISTDNNFSGTELTDLSATVSFQSKIGNHTELRLDVSRSEQKRDTFSRRQTFTTLSATELLPVDELGGGQRYAYVWEDAGANLGAPGLVFFAGQNYDLNRDQKDESTTYSFRGDTLVGNWEIGYMLGFARGRSEFPDRLRMSLSTSFDTRIRPLDPEIHLLPSATNNTINGRIVSPFGPSTSSGFPLPLFSEAGFALYNDLDIYVPGASGGRLENDLLGTNDRATIDFKVRRNFGNSVFSYLEGGLFFEDSESREIRQDAVSSYNFSGIDSFTDIGFAFSDNNLAGVGLDSRIGVLREADILAFRNNFDRLSSGDDPAIIVTEQEIDPRNRDAVTAEEELSAYLQTQLNFGRLELIGGVRLYRTKLATTSLTSPQIFDENFVQDQDFSDRFASLLNLSETQMDLLPRLLVNFRWRENLVVRGAYYLTVARPSLQQLNSQQLITYFQAPIFGPSGNQPTIIISEGNPELKPAFTDNFDVSLEFYDDNLGVVKASVFYKDTENFLFDNETQGFNVLDGVVLPADRRFQNLPSNIFVQGSRPENSRFGARSWGVETSIERQFTSLPGVWGGLGLYANYTYTDSSKTEIFSFSGSPTGMSEVDDAPYTLQPQHTGTFAITYNMNNVDASLTYSAQSRYLETFRPHNLHIYQESIDGVDLRVEYLFDRLGGTWRAYFEGSALLDSNEDPGIAKSFGGDRGTPKINREATYFGGRVFRIGVVGSF